MATDREHTYEVDLSWTGNRGSGTSTYRAYGRDHLISAAGKAAIAGSSEAIFRGDATRWNPEELLVASLSACHQLWYLHLCADARITVLAYVDRARGTMIADAASGAGRFTSVVLRPNVIVASNSDRNVALSLHHEAHARCYIANSVNFPVTVEPIIETKRDCD
jgi:organic hydroperoxide reductase OsmC/OhrA